jgi:hypothetical protein
MLIPEFLLGDFRSVRPRARTFVNDVTAGKALDELRMTETESTPGLLVLSPDATYRSAAHFQMYVPMAFALESLLPDESKLRLFDTLLSACWGTLCLLDQSTGLLRLDESRRDALVKSVLRCWPVYTQEGNRFAPSLYGPTVLWRVPTMLQPELCRLGVPIEEVQAPLVNNDLIGLLSRYPHKLGKLLAEVRADSSIGRK